MKDELKKFAKQILEFVNESEEEQPWAAERWLKEVPQYCKDEDWAQARENCENVLDLFKTPYIRGRAHIYLGAAYLCPEESSLNRAVDCFQQSQKAFLQAGKLWSEAVAWWGLGIARFYSAVLLERVGRKRKDLQKDMREALSAFQSSQDALNKLENLDNVDKNLAVRIAELRKQIESASEQVFRKLSGEQPNAHKAAPSDSPHPPQKKVIPLSFLPVIDEVAAGKEKVVSDGTIGYIQAGDLKIDEQLLEIELLKGSQVTFLPEYDYFAVLVSGDSMDEAGIAANDYVILQKPKFVPVKPDNGDIVAVVFRAEDDKATLKRFHFDKPSDRVILRPESSNPEHKPRPVPSKLFGGDTPSVAIAGIAIAVLRKVQ